MQSENMLKLIASRITQAREALHMTQKQFAEALEVSRSTICLYEAGTSKPDVLFMHRLAQIAPFGIEYLLGLSDVKTQDANIRTVCRYTHLSEKAVEKLHNRGEFCRPYLSRMLEEGNVYLLAEGLIELRESYRTFTLETMDDHQKKVQEVKKQFGEGYALLSPQDKLAMQQYTLNHDWQDFLNVLMKEARSDGQKGE